MRKPMRILVAAGAVGALVAGISGCSTPEPSEPGNVELTMLTFETAAVTAEFWTETIDAGLKDLPGVTVKQILNPSLDRDTYAKTLQASGQFPDILISITPKDYTAAGLLQPYDKAYLEENFQLPDAQADSEGNTYIPPSNAQALPWVYYNKAIFAEYGLTVPTTFAEHVANIKKLNDANSGVVPIENVGADAWAAHYSLSAILTADILGDNPNWIRDRYEDKVHFTDANVVAAVQKQVDLIKMGAYSPTTLSTDFPTANANMLAGNSAMYIMGSWFSGSGYLTAEQADNIGVFLYPSESGDQVLGLFVGGSLSVSAKSKNVDTAMKFAEAYSANAAPYRALVTADGLIPLLKKISLEDLGAPVYPVFTEGYNLVFDDNVKKTAPFGSGVGQDTFPAEVNTAYQAMAQALFTNSDVKSQLAELDKAWDTSANK